MNCWVNSFIAPPSLSSSLQPINNLGPFDCNILPPPYNLSCQEAKDKYSNTVYPDCSRLPPQYQPFCRALGPPVDPDPFAWPNSAAPPQLTAPEFQLARERCAALGPREYYSCLFSTTKYPYYEEFGPVPKGKCGAGLPLVNRETFQCLSSEEILRPFPQPVPMTGGYQQVYPPNNMPYLMPKVWVRK